MTQGMSSIIMIVALFAIMYFMMIRPENKRKKKAQEMRDGLKKGDTITTIGGIIGKVVSVNNDTFVIETGEDRVRVEFAKWALSSVGVQTSEQPEAEKPSKKNDVPEEPVDEIPAETEEKYFRFRFQRHKKYLPWNMLQ